MAPGKKIMRTKDFKVRLDVASFYATHFASSMVRDKLPYEFRYCAILNASFDDNREADETVYPEDNGVIHEDLDGDQVVHLLCRDGRVPQWIDVSVAYATADHCHLSLTCCGRYHADDHRLCYFDQGTQPFGIKSPALPPSHVDGQAFNLPSPKEFYVRIRKLQP